MDFDELKLLLEQNNQKHILDNVHDDESKNYLLDLFSTLNITELCESIEKTLTASDVNKVDCLPPCSTIIGGERRLDNSVIEDLEAIGFKALRDNKVAIILLSGGQGTRLGFEYPKGLYKVGLPSGKSILQLQVERMVQLMKLTEKRFNCKVSIQWYIMTSEFTMNHIKEYLHSNDYFGFNKEDITVFKQFTVPSVTFEGKFILQTPNRIAESPEGNGGIYRALRENGIIENMVSKGVEYIQIYCVDNIMVRLADPKFIGYCVKKDLQFAVKTVCKEIPEERLGVVGRVGDSYQIIEYSEISEELSKAQDGNRLLFHCGSICIFFFNIHFLQRVSNAEFDKYLNYHIAKKKIPFWDPTKNQTITPSQPNGIKLEKFIFDVMPFAEKFGIWEVDREDEFSPLKNPSGSASECPETCRESILKQGEKFARAAGAILSKDAVVEISPLVSLFGENLMFLNNLHLNGTCHITLDDEGNIAVIKN